MLTQDLVYRCRNAHCKSSLSPPVENRRDAFCCQKCADGFYRGHCRVCERPLAVGNSRREICDDQRCRGQFRRHREQFFGPWYPNPFSSSKPEKSSTKSTLKTGIKFDRAWTQIAGPTLSTISFRFATLPLDREFAREIAKTNHGYWLERSELPVNILGGYKFPGARSIDLNPATSPRSCATKPYLEQIPADLSIPPFLRRRS
jgi:hypothetical protein